MFAYGVTSKCEVNSTHTRPNGKTTSKSAPHPSNDEHDGAHRHPLGVLYDMPGVNQLLYTKLEPDARKPARPQRCEIISLGIRLVAEGVDFRVPATVRAFGGGEGEYWAAATLEFPDCSGLWIGGLGKADLYAGEVWCEEGVGQDGVAQGFEKQVRQEGECGPGVYEVALGE